MKFTEKFRAEKGEITLKRSNTATFLKGVKAAEFVWGVENPYIDYVKVWHPANLKPSSIQLLSRAEVVAIFGEIKLRVMAEFKIVEPQTLGARHIIEITAEKPNGIDLVHITVYPTSDARYGQIYKLSPEDDVILLAFRETVSELK